MNRATEAGNLKRMVDYSMTIAYTWQPVPYTVWKFPFTDSYGDRWVDPNGYIKCRVDKNFIPYCFICHRMTTRRDINYNDRAFCNSMECIEAGTKQRPGLLRPVLKEEHIQISIWDNEGGAGT